MLQKIIITLLALSIMSFGIFWTKADPAIKDPCDPEMIAEAFTASILSHKTSFFSKDQLKSIEEKTIRLSLQEDIVSRIRALHASEKSMLENYHEIQRKLFEDAISQGLDQYKNIASQAQNNKELRKPHWKSSLDTYPIIKLYKKKFVEETKVPDIIPVIPTLIVGLEATLNYAVFSCNYTVDVKRVYKDSRSPQDVVVNRKNDEKDRAEKLLKAKRIMDLALNSYDALALAYPQHIAYERLIVELKKLRARFGVLEEITADCVYPNHLYSSCRK